jgi:adenosylmethionine-8-amino-7-oxononanoate aminotransferase
VLANEPLARAALEPLLGLPIVGDVRGLGYFWALELVRDQLTREPLWERGLICRREDRADPIVQIAPPLIAPAELFAEIAAILREGLEIAAERIGDRPPVAAQSYS